MFREKTLRFSTKTFDATLIKKKRAVVFKKAHISPPRSGDNGLRCWERGNRFSRGAHLALRVGLCAEAGADEDPQKQIGEANVGLSAD